MGWAEYQPVELAGYYQESLPGLVLPRRWN